MVSFSCIKIKDDYPEIQFYKIGNIDSFKSSDTDLDFGLQIRSVSISGLYHSRQIVAHTSENEIKKYYYNRWADDIATMTKDYFVRKFSASGIFGQGVTDISSVTLPDFVLELDILDVNIFNSDSRKVGDNYVEVLIKATLVNVNTRLSDNEVVLERNYSQKINRKDNSIANAPIALDKALDIIGNQLLSDIVLSLKKDYDN